MTNETDTPGEIPELEYDLTLFPAPVLRQRALPIESFDDELQHTVEAMYARMYASSGVGLAAPQVGLKQRILVLNAEGERGKGEELAMINPEIVGREGAPSDYDEGCLSFPGIYAQVTRPERCTVKYQDVQGNAHEATFEGFTSRIIQHEYDHLEGVLLVDRMSPADKLRNKSALEDLVARFKRARAAR